MGGEGRRKFLAQATVEASFFPQIKVLLRSKSPTDLQYPPLQLQLSDPISSAASFFSHLTWWWLQLLLLLWSYVTTSIIVHNTMLYWLKGDRWLVVILWLWGHSNSCTYLRVLWILYADVLQKLHQHHRYLNGDVDTAVIEWYRRQSYRITKWPGFFLWSKLPSTFVIVQQHQQQLYIIAAMDYNAFVEASTKVLVSTLGPIVDYLESLSYLGVNSHFVKIEVLVSKLQPSTTTIHWSMMCVTLIMIMHVCMYFWWCVG